MGEKRHTQYTWSLHTDQHGVRTALGVFVTTEAGSPPAALCLRRSGSSGSRLDGSLRTMESFYSKKKLSEGSSFSSHR